MGAMRRLACLALLLVVLSACASWPEHAYYPDPGAPETRVLAEALYRAARAASEDPERYSFALMRVAEVRAYTAEDATFYFSEGLARQRGRVVDALVAHEVAHELLDHVGQRRALSLSVTGGFMVLGFAMPGLSLLDLVANPLIVRAYTRDQELSADQKAVEVLRDMGYTTPRRVLADALREAAQINSAPDRGPMATEPDLTARLAALEPLEPVALSR
jgi:Zn-dependent protease with chaperone function